MVLDDLQQASPAQALHHLGILVLAVGLGKLMA